MRRLQLKQNTSLALGHARGTHPLCRSGRSILEENSAPYRPHKNAISTQSVLSTYCKVPVD